jgi:hypothetical protein
MKPHWKAFWLVSFAMGGLNAGIACAMYFLLATWVPSAKEQLLSPFFLGALAVVVVFSALGFGALAALGTALWHSWSAQRLAAGKSPYPDRVLRNRTIELQLPYDQVFNLCIRSLASISRCRVQQRDFPQGKITARAGANWRTWGDIITFDLCRTEEGGIRVEVCSRPAVRTTLFDYGKNLENIQRISSFLIKQGDSAPGNTGHSRA